ncbi:hypothetical protein J6590_005110 [Homalodisca vitripennis]|nr:hypothetical protein J6590_005110 [Homalodisca vitripennis]
MEDSPWMFWRRRRHLVTFLIFLGISNIYMLRVNLNVAIVAMNSPYNVTLSNGTIVQARAQIAETKRCRNLLSVGRITPSSRSSIMSMFKRTTVSQQLLKKTLPQPVIGWQNNVATAKQHLYRSGDQGPASIHFFWPLYHKKQDFNWNSKMQGVALSSFFYGYTCTQLLGGWLGTRFGGRTVFGLGVLVTALFTTVTPLAATTNFYLLVAVRVIEGVFEFELETYAMAG